ncbi:MAG: DUF2927 domain-containing protein [Nitratireductor sp.]|nr:DUF2927 domain-containing protein [Nitratireductor sp.]
MSERTGPAGETLQGAARRFALFAAMLCLMLAALPAAARAASNAEILRGFNLTVFGAEYAPFGIQSRYIRKFAGPVRFNIVNLAGRDRTAQVAQFIRSLNSSIQGIRTETTRNAATANFNVYVVDREDYVKIAREKVYRRPTAAVPGKCLVRSVFSRTGIIRSDAVVVSDGGEALFRRCMIEEILQGLGPLNEHPTLKESMFNDRTRHTRFTRFDRIILNMLYDRRIHNGASIEAVQEILPAVLADTKRRIR